MSRTRPTVLEILRHLPRNNCRECRLPSCMAFANQVAQGLRKPGDCPYLDRALPGLADLGPIASAGSNENEERLLELRERIQHVDLAAVADRVGGRLDATSLVIQCLGRDFTIDNQSELRSQCHANFWVLIPLLDYVIHAAEPPPPGVGREPRGEWIKYDELGQGLSGSDYFSKTCESALCRLVDVHPDLFADLLDLFAAEHVDHGFDADLSVVLRPLPKVPLLVCHWKADPPFDSKLSIYFDRVTPSHLSGEATTILVMGIVEMLKRIVTRHTFATGSSGSVTP
jgi:Domain of unknown function (DUF3786)/Putative Fe-S cluster